MPATIKDVARRAGVAISTVSLAFNQPVRVADATRKRILAVAREVGYTPSAIRSPLRRSVLVVSYGSFSNFSLLVTQGIHETLDLSNFEMIFVNVNDDSREDYAYAYDLLEQKRVAGLITILDKPIIHSFIDLARERGIPAVMCASGAQIAGVGSVKTDNTDAGRQLARLFLDRKIDSIGMITDYNPGVEPRVASFLETLRAHSVSVPESLRWRVPVATTVCGSLLAQELIFSQQELPRALFCINDDVALGVIQTFSRFGIAVPQDVGITGCDDIPAAHLSTPPLTTVSIPFRENGLQCALLLSRMIEGLPSEHISIGSKLVVRQSL